MITKELLDRLDAEHEKLVQPTEFDKEMRRLARLGLWAEQVAIPEMNFTCIMLDNIQAELYASVYTVTDDEFDRVYSARDFLYIALEKLPK